MSRAEVACGCYTCMQESLWISYRQKNKTSSYQIFIILPITHICHNYFSIFLAGSKNTYTLFLKITGQVMVYSCMMIHDHGWMKQW